MKHAYDTAVPSRPRRARVALPALLLAAAALTLSACATPVAGASPSPTTSSTPTPTVEPTADPTPVQTPSADPSPSESATSDTPYNGEILVVTSEIRDGSLEVTAMVPGVSESGGTCTLTLDATQQSVSVTANEGKDVTYCGLMSIPVESDAAEVQFHVGYASSTLRALSDTATIEPAP